MASRTLFTRLAVAGAKQMNTPTQARLLSTQGDAALQKLRSALEEYRVKNYTQEIPSRFRKEIIQAAKIDQTDRVALEGMQRVIANINMQHIISYQEMETIFREIGGENKSIPADRLMKII